ncbi:MAG TPA: 2-phosphosulfolactate phosphatase [Steroidobacteraceae bacterium]|nr:2-phosphosulfolactate phosphatase [Steroidobacteraceae bacterium]
MQIEIVDFVAGARAARGVAVIIDVFRAFSVACYAFDGGARRIIPFADADAALALKRANPGWLAFGERYGKKLDGFDLGNSPYEVTLADLRGKTIVHTTHAGTQGLSNATGADVVLTGSLVNAGAICSYIRSLAPSHVTLVRMGQAAQQRCAEDDLCAEILYARLSGRAYDTTNVRSRLRAAPAAQKFFDPAATWAPEPDFDLCTDVDRFDFVLRLTGRDQPHPWLEGVAV